MITIQKPSFHRLANIVDALVDEHVGVVKYVKELRRIKCFSSATDVPERPRKFSHHSSDRFDALASILLHLPPVPGLGNRVLPNHSKSEHEKIAPQTTRTRSA